MKTTEISKSLLNRRERRAAQLLSHYDRCAQLGRLLGNPLADGKKISVALFKLEQQAHAGATASCNGESFYTHFHVSAKQRVTMPWVFKFSQDEDAWDQFAEKVTDEVRFIFGAVPTGFFVNGDARGYALKIDTDKTSLDILCIGMERDWGSNILLSPAIDGN